MRKAFVGFVVLAWPVLAAYTYFLTDTFSSGINGTTWQSNGTIAGNGTDGLYSAAANGGAVIYKPAIPDGTAEYEAKATFKITASGGTFVVYLRASNDALTGPATQGSYYAMEMTPTVSGGGCTMAVYHYKRVSGAVTLLAGQTVACANDMSLRMVQRNGYYIGMTSLGELIFIAEGSLTTGKPGFGARGLPAGNGILKSEIGPADRTAPNGFPTGSVRSSVDDNRVDLAWEGVADDANGSGRAFYQVHRNGSYFGNFRMENVTDTTVVAGSTYTYTIYAVDLNHNASGTTVTVKTPPVGGRDLRNVGVRPLGSYWGASPENIDLRSGNLSFSVPAVTAQGRGGMAVPFRLSYNSQNWRKDPGGVWKLGTDVGFGWGWKLLAGSLTPIYSDWYTIHHYRYTDSTGAEYMLDTNTGGIWTAKQGIFVEYDATARRLYFPSGTFWEFACTANGTEADAGTMYPTRLVDTNGNEIKLRYQGGLNYGGTNGSGRVTEVEDARAQAVAGGVYRTYAFTYNNDAIPHLTSITSDIGDGTYLAFNQSAGHALNDPFNGASYGSAGRLNSMTLPGSMGQFAMEYNSGSMELNKVTMPRAGTLQWVYGAKTLGENRTLMEVTSRTIDAKYPVSSPKTYTFFRYDGWDETHLSPYLKTVTDASNNSQKAFYFNKTVDYRMGLLELIEERNLVGGLSYARVSNVTWAQTANGNPYISRSESHTDAYTAAHHSTMTEQTVDDHGNMTVRKEYDHYTPASSPVLARTFTYSYTGYPARHIWNRLLTAQMQKPGGSLHTLVTNTYDIYPYGSAPLVAYPAMLRQHDTANYGTTNIQRGNVTSSVSMGRTITMTYDGTGNVLSTTDGYGHTASQIMDENRNYVVPKTSWGGSLQTSMSWNSYNAPLSATGPNSDTMSFNYDSYARPASRTEANGRVSSMTYGTSAPYWSKATSGTRWTTSWVDGFGRPYKTESGYGATTVSVTDTEYAPCACSPLGKLFRTSLPHAPGAAPLWTEYYYDALGRTVEVRQPNGAGSTTTLYTGAVTKVTDPAGKWTQYESDALGNLIKVTEPRPNGAGAVDTTTYAYSEFGKLLTVTMPRPGMGVGNATTVTQTRTWVYDSIQRLTSVTHPESGTTSYLYNADRSMHKKTDAKGQWIAYSYDTDGRVTAARKYLANGTETCGTVLYSYGSQSFDPSFTQNAAGRLAATETGCLNEGPGKLIELYSYNAAGAVTKKRLRILRGYGSAAVDKDVAYGYGTGGKLSTVLYPGATTPYTYSYDDMERPIKMTGPSMFNGTQIDHVKDVVYGVAGQVTSMKYLAGETIDQTVGGVEFTVPAYFTENKTYNAFYQLTRQTVGSLVDLEYKFSPDKNNGRITGRKNYNSGEDVVYEYDELNRLIKASATGGGGWSQSFVHDGFGNLREQKVNSGVAPAVMLNVNMSNNRLSDSGWTYDGNGNTLSMPVVGGGTAGMAYDVDNRLTTWTKTSTGAVESYGYLADNKRVWKKMPNGTEYYYFYGAGGQKLLTYTVSSLSPFALGGGPAANVYFGGKLIRADSIAVVHDRLGSVVARGNCTFGCSGATAKDYFPYGEEIGAATVGNQDKFGTYHRDQTSGLDYADQRYFSGLQGRFLTSDPYEASGGPNEPGSWNRAAYVGGDPVNFGDPTGLYKEGTPYVAGCMVNGIFRTDCDMYLRSQDNRDEYIATPAPKAIVRLAAAQIALYNRTNFSNDCRKGLANVNIGAGVLEPEMLASGANNLSLADGTVMAQSIASAYGNASLGNTAQYTWNNDAEYKNYRDANKVTQMRVLDIFKASKGISAWTPPGGGTIYINPDRLQSGSPTRNQALIMHELLHEMYSLDDTTIMDNLGISKAEQAGGSVAITNWLEKKCMKGKENY